MVKNIKGFTQPVSKLVELNTHHFDSLVQAQKEAAENYRTIVQSRMEAASEISDPVALAQFITDQMALAQSSYEKMVNNSRALFEGLSSYNSDVIELFQKSTAQLKDQVDKEKELVDK